MTQGPSNKRIPLLRLLKYAPFLQPVVRTFYGINAPSQRRDVLGISFPHPIGVAAGVDKQGELTDAMACFSPAFVEIGPVRDVNSVIENLQKRKSDLILLGNLSNAQHLERAFTLIYDFVDIIVLNISHGTTVSTVVDHLLELRRYNDTNRPILFKIASDMTQDDLVNVTEYMLGSGIDGVMVGPEFLAKMRNLTLGLLPIITTAEISAPERAAQLLEAGADLIAVTNSPLHYGPRLLQRTVKFLEKDKK